MKKITLTCIVENDNYWKTELSGNATNRDIEVMLGHLIANFKSMPTSSWKALLHSIIRKLIG